MRDRKVALVTGAARGIGLACAKKFLAEGYAVGLNDIDGAALRATVAALPQDRVVALEADVADPVAGAAAVAAEAWSVGLDVRVQPDSLVPDIRWVARLGAAANPDEALPKPFYLAAPDARPQEAARLPRQ